MKIKVDFSTYIYLLLAILSGFIYEISFFYLSLLVHELGHICMIKWLKKNIVQLEISPLGGILFIEGLDNDFNWKEFLVYLGGPLFSLVFYVFVRTTGSDEPLTQAALYVLVINLLPILPFDGAKLMQTLMQNVLWYRLTCYLAVILSFVMLGLLTYLFFEHYLYLGLILVFLIKNILGLFELKENYYVFLFKKFLSPNPRLRRRLVGESHYYARLYKGYNNDCLCKYAIISEKTMLNRLFKGNND